MSKFFEGEKVKDDIIDLAKLACGYVEKHFFAESFHCANFIDMMGPNVLWPVVFDGILTKDRICDETLKLCNKPIITEIDLQNVVDDTLAEKPDKIKDDNFVNNLYNKVKGTNRNTFKAVHISDVHMDLEYKVGSNA